MHPEPDFQLKLAARSTLITTFFGAACLYWPTFSFSGSMRWLWLAAVTLPAIVLLVRAASYVRQTRSLISAPADAARWKTLRKFYFLDVFLEFALVGCATSFLVLHGHYDMIPAACGVIVGLHYVPLALIFHASRYYSLAAILVAGSLATLLISSSHVRYVAGSCLIGLTLWTSAAILLSRRPAS